MANPSAPAKSATQYRIFGRSRIIVVAALLVLLAVCLTGSWLTRAVMANLAFLRTMRAQHNQSLVDVNPWETAQALASLAVTAEEQEYAREAEHLADHEVDQAFAAALRSAHLQARDKVLTGPALALQQRVTQLEQEIAGDKATVDRLKAAVASPAGSGKNAPPADDGNLQVAQAQLGLDSDELTDAKRDLARASGDLSMRIQDELAAHEASMRKYDSEQENGGGQIAVVSERRHSTLAGRLGAWFNQRTRYAMIEQALQQTEDDIRGITAEHNALEGKASNDAAKSGAATLAGLQERTVERQILSIDDDRIQTDQQLASVYSKWGDQVQVQHDIVLHLILQSFELIIFILICMILGDAAIRKLLAHPALERRQAETLRTILEVSLQVIGLILIVLVFFGPPKETTTMIGLATAALTIALQDYIIAFLGWFFLVGKNGIRVGDWVEINGVGGEVTEVGLIKTTLLETSGLTDKGVPTGRRISFLNGFAIRGQYFNFSTEGQWLWDEITVSVPDTVDAHALARSVEAMVRTETAENAPLAEKEWKRGSRVTRLSRLSAAASVNLRPSIAGIEMQVRYVTRAPERAETRDRLYRRMVELLHEKNRPEEPLAAEVS